MAPDPSSVTEWLFAAEAGDEEACARLWQRYVHDLVLLARRCLGDRPRRVTDEEDVVVVAFEQFFGGIRQGRFPRLCDRDDLWQVLVLLTRRRAIDQSRRAEARQRDEVGESRLDPGPASTDRGTLDRVAAPPLNLEWAEAFTEEFRERLAALPDDLREIVLLKLQSYTNEEIAAKRHCVVRTVERKLGIIRSRWRDEG